MSIQRLSHDYLRNEVSYDDSGPFMYYAEHVAEIERAFAAIYDGYENGYQQGMETMRALCIEAVEAMDIHGCHRTKGIIDCNCIGTQVVAALREVQP